MHSLRPLLNKCALLAPLVCLALFQANAEPVNPQNANGSITTAIAQPDGKVIICGAFGYVGSVERAGIARLLADGTLDATFDPGAGADGAINLLALRSDGKVVIAGYFTKVAGTRRPRIARLNADGSLDPSFDPGSGPNDVINQLLVAQGDQVVLAGNFTAVNGIPRRFLARLDSSGSLDMAFDAGKNLGLMQGVSTGVYKLAFSPDGRLVVAGLFSAANKYDLARLSIDGTIDMTFPGGLSIGALAIQPDGKVLVSGSPPGSPSPPRLYRLNADGTQDKGFRTVGAAILATSLRLQPDGRILVQQTDTVRRLNPDGTDDATFAPPQLASGQSTPPFVTAMDLQSDGRILISGVFNSVDGSPRVGVAELRTDGSVDPAFTPDPTIIATGRVLNISTRSVVGTGDNVLIGGFIIDGSVPKKVIIRAIGPSLAGSKANVPSPLLDPVISLRSSSGDVLAQNDNWRTTQIGGLIAQDQASDIEATGVAPNAEAESALIVTLDPGPYTAIVSGADGDTGTALVEVYDLDGNSAASRIANISTRGAVGTGDNVMIGGVILSGTHPTQVLVRAIGPSLSTVAGALADPALALYNANGSQMATNDDWKSDQANIESTKAAPTNDKESAMLMLLQPGNYTAVLSGVGKTTGTALIEFYAL